MSHHSYYAEPTHDEIDRAAGPIVLEFGAAGCRHCHALQPHLDALLSEHPSIRHIKIEDRKGKPLGRTFGVKLWPTLVLLRDGHVWKQLVRPTVAEVREGLAAIALGVKPKTRNGKAMHRAH